MRRVDPNDDPQNPYGTYRPDGLYFFGPKGPISVLALLIAFTFCNSERTVPENARRQRVAYRGRRMKELRNDGLIEDEPRPWLGPRYGYVGKFNLPRKPANSGRKRKAA